MAQAGLVGSKAVSGGSKACDVNPIPADKIAVTQNANVAVMAGAILMCCACMWVVSHTSSLPLAMVAAIGFGLFNNTLFSLMHEAVHGMFHGKRSVNEFAGFVAAAFFPTIFPIQRLSHMTHHKNNRSSVERFDYYEADDFHFLKVAQWYSILTGLYWLFIPVFATVYALFGNLIPWQKLVATDGTLGRQTSAKPYFESLQLIPMWQIRMGFALTLCVQALMIWGLDLSLWGWAACYVAFGLMWSSLQYADHAFSPLDNIKGTWNLRVNGLVRLAYLNYHFHQCHHRDITIPWRFLPEAERPDDRSIAFKDMLYFMWSGPRLTPGAVIPEHVSRRNNLTVCMFLTAIFCGFFWIVYGLGDHIHHMAQFRFDLSTGLDRAIPFFPQMAIFYLCISPILLAAPFVMRSPERLLPFGVALGAEFLIALAVYYMFPVDVPAVAYSKDGLGGALMQFADWINLDGNNFPSLHVALVVSAMWAYREFLGRAAYFAGLVLATFVVASTLLLHQHLLADVAGGILLAAAGMGFVYPAARRKLMAIKNELGEAVNSG